MILHLVTDRRRLAPAADEETAAHCLVEQVRFAVAAGIDVVQLRERDMDGRALVALAMRLVAVTRGSRTRVVVNDRLDVAIAARAHGVHLRGDSFDASRVRTTAPPGFLIGRSVRTPSDAAAAGPVDYLIAGTVWATSSKPSDQPLLGPSGLAEVVKAGGAPVVAIGGVQLERVAQVARTGAAGVAAIGAWMDSVGGCRAVALHDLTRSYREAFDAANMEREFPPS